MARNKLTDLNNHLFAQLERLNDEDLTDEKIKAEVGRAKAISGIASQVIKSAKVTIDAMKLVASGDYTVNELPEMIGAPKKSEGKNI
jgi:hypothetical protein